jgi:hypothetical protein
MKNHNTYLDNYQQRPIHWHLASKTQPFQMLGTQLAW